jgi:TRAP-type C4-dicarboxylate transport system permease small subunit
MARLLNLHDAITRGGYQLAALIVLLIAGSFCYEVAARYFFDAPTSWANAVVSYLLCPVIFLAMPEQTRRHSHIAITIMVERANTSWRRIWRISIAAVAAATCFGVFWISAGETWTQYRDSVLTVAAYEIPKWWISIFITYGLLSSALYFLREMFDPTDLPQPSGAVPQ